MHFSVLLSLSILAAFLLFKVISFIAAEAHHRRREQELGCSPPASSPNSSPLGFDNIQQVLLADKERRIPDYIKKRIDYYSEKAGRRVGTFRLNILGTHAFWTVEPKNIQAILATQFDDFELGHIRKGNFAPLLGSGIFASDGKQWEHSRALLRPQFVRDQVSDLDLEERHVQDMMKCLPVNADGWTDVKDLKTLFFRLTIDSVTEFLFGQSVNSQLAHLSDGPKNSANEISDADFAYSFDQAQKRIAHASWFGDFYWFAHDAKLKENCRRCHTYIDQIVQGVLSKPKAPPQTQSGKNKYVFLEALAEETRDAFEIRTQCLNMLIAGRDTTASLLSFLFMSFDQHPHIYKKLRSVVLDEFGTYRDPKDITFARLKACKYLQWCLNETLRLYPVVPVDGRRSIRDTTLPVGGGPDGLSPVYIRKNQSVDYCVYAMHRRTDLWGPDAEEFKPERWDGRRTGWEYLPFNGGPRICLGQQFALTETGYVAVRLLQRFEECEGVENGWDSPENGGLGYVRMALTLTMSPADGVKVRLREARD